MVVIANHIVTAIGYCLHCKSHLPSGEFQRLFRTGYHAYRDSICHAGICQKCSALKLEKEPESKSKSDI